MNEIICPNCKKAFKVDEAGFADILKQVRDHQFEEELQNRLNLAEKEKESAVKILCYRMFFFLVACFKGYSLITFPFLIIPLLFRTV